MLLLNLDKVATSSFEEKENFILKATDYCIYGLFAFFIILFLLARFLK